MIRLQSLSIKNLRGIREGQVDGFADVNVLVGRNNSGKTTVIEAITRVATTGGLQQDVFGRNVEQLWQQARSAIPGVVGFTAPPAGPASLLFYRQDMSDDIEICGTLCSNGVNDATEQLTFRLLRPATASGRTVRQPHSPLRGRGLDQQTTQGFCSGITVFRPSDAFNVVIEQRFWPALLSDRRDRALTKILNEVFGLDAESFQLLPNNQFTVLFHDFSLPLDVQGDGTRAAMRTLMTLSMLKGTLFMIEEPECHQHPGSLERFAGALCRLAKSQFVQVIVSTHSGECVRSFMQAAKAAESSAAVFHLSLDNGKQEARRLDPEAVETLTNTGVDVRFLDLYA